MTSLNPFDRGRMSFYDYETYIYRGEEGEIEVPITCDGEIYSGSHADDDPAEFIIESCVVSEDNEPFKKGQKIELTREEEEMLGERYMKTL